MAAVLAGCSTGTVPAVPSAKVYPAMGQFPDQQERDSLACTTWAQQENAKASGFGGVMGTIGGAVAGSGTAGYGFNQDGADRAYTVCMKGRGNPVFWSPRPSPKI
jgi:hypothetical protein